MLDPKADNPAGEKGEGLWFQLTLPVGGDSSHAGEVGEGLRVQLALPVRGDSSHAGERGEGLCFNWNYPPEVIAFTQGGGREGGREGEVA